MDIAKQLVFKGGTSLSKAWKLINRFSEDIDLAINPEYFMTSKKGWIKKEITDLRKQAGKYSSGKFFDELQSKFREEGLSDLNFIVVDAKDSDQDPRIIEIYYPNVITPSSEYVLPRVQIEIGCRSLREPFSYKKIGSLVDEMYADFNFAEPLFEIPTVNPERTFLEKIFLLHEEFQRPKSKIRVDRLSRHLYDVVKLFKTEFAENALKDKKLYQTIVDHRYKFTRLGGVNYNLHKPQTINPIPVPGVIGKWKEDYNTMIQEMIYENDAPSFDNIITDLTELREKINALPWGLDKQYPVPKH